MVTVPQSQTSTMPQYPSAKRPWMDKEYSVGMKLLIGTGFVFLVLIAFGAGSVFLLALSTLGTEAIGSALLNITISLAVTAASVFGLVKLWPIAFSPAAVKQKHGVGYPATSLGSIFSTRYGAIAFARTFTGEGSMTFLDKSLTVHGTMPPNAGVQLGVIIVVTVVPLVVFGCGLGLIPALLIAQAIGKKEMSVDTTYEQMSEVKVEGCNLTFRRILPMEGPRKIKLRIPQADGERLYRELYAHKPEAVAMWQMELHQLESENPSKPAEVKRLLV
jgi:hypothetical protein